MKTIKKVTGAADLPIAPRGTKWSADAAIKRVRELTKATEKPNARYARAFMVLDGDADNFTSYKLPFADVVDGELHAIPKALFAIAAVLDGGRGGVDLSDGDRDKVKARVADYYEKMAREFDDEDITVPWKDKSAAELLIAFGSSVKVAKSGKIEGYLVQFGSPATKDLDGEYFADDTEFGIDVKGGKEVTMPMYYSHGFNDKIGKRRVGYMTLKGDDNGIFLQAEIDKAETYRAEILKLAKEGKLGASSGAVSHLVEKEPDADGKSVRITQWPIGEGSLTPAPADYRNVMTVKEFAKGYILPPANNRPHGRIFGNSDSEKFVNLEDAGDDDTYFTDWDESSITSSTLWSLQSALQDKISSLLYSFDDADPDQARAYLTGLFAEYSRRAVSLIFAIQSGMGDEPAKEAAKAYRRLVVAAETVNMSPETILALKEGKKLSGESRKALEDIADRMKTAHSALKSAHADLHTFLSDGEIEPETSGDDSANKSAKGEDVRVALAIHLKHRAERLGVNFDN